MSGMRQPSANIAAAAREHYASISFHYAEPAAEQICKNNIFAPVMRGVSFHKRYKADATFSMRACFLRLLFQRSSPVGF